MDNNQFTPQDNHSLIKAQVNAGQAMAKEVVDTYNQKADAQQLSSDMRYAWLKPYAYSESTRAESSSFAWLYMWLWKIFTKGSKLTKSIILLLVLLGISLYLIFR